MPNLLVAKYPLNKTRIAHEAVYDAIAVIGVRMKLPTIDEVERSVGGRPNVDNSKVRVSFYLSPDEE